MASFAYVQYFIYDNIVWIGQKKAQQTLSFSINIKYTAESQ